MRGLVCCAAVVAGVAVALLIPAAGMASASGAQTAALSVRNSRYFAGYQAGVTAGSATSSAAHFRVPKLSCTSKYRAIIPNVGVNTVRNFSGVGVFVGCRNGKARYFPSLVVNGNEVDYTSTRFSAGDLIRVYVKVTTTGTTVRVTDVNTGVTKRRTGSGARPDAAWVGDDAWITNSGTLLGVPNFGKLTFTHCYIDGKTLASLLPVKYRRVNKNGIVQIATGALSSTGTVFPTIYKHS